jgi:steroid 5-alpha reductase family enzyme
MSNAPAPRSPQASRLARDFAWIAASYGIATLVAALVVGRSPGEPPWLPILAADVAATLVIFGFSKAFDNSSVYDAYWSVAPMLIAPALAFRDSPAPLARRVLVCALVLAWGARLTWNWARGWQGMGHEDWRYVDQREKTGRLYWLVSLAGLHLMPTILVFLGCLPLFPALLTGRRPLGWLDALAALVTLGAILVETIADQQLLAFRAAPKEPGAVLDRGLWSLSRHPNYLGELSFWWGIFLFGLAADPSSWASGAGALAITALFVFISVPLLDRRSLARRPSYAEHMRRVPALFPRLFRRR